MNALADQHLTSLPANIVVPTYDRSALTPGIVHVGVGNFHRAHQSWYLHRLMQQGLDHDWAIIGGGVRSGDALMRERLLGQNCLTTLMMLDPSNDATEVVGSMIDFVPVQPDNQALIAAMTGASIRIVSLTVTESGYYLDPATQAFDGEHEDMQHDAANPRQPRTVFGAMVEALRQRRDSGVGPFTGLSCDNIQGNGEILRQTIVSLARLSDPSLADWIDQHCSFPNSMVDCIVPATGDSELARARTMGVSDSAPVTHEQFRQWVIEDDFCAGRPQWEKVGATFTDRVHDYELMKIRILNGGHQIVSAFGEILGLETIADCLAHPAISALFTKVALNEIAPHVPTVPGMEPAAYVDLIHQRFSNPKIHDTTRRVAFDGSARHPGFVLPSVRDCLRGGLSVAGLALVEAAWATLCQGVREDGSVIEANDPQWEKLNAVALRAKDDPMVWLQMESVYGDLVQAKSFVDAFVSAFNQIQGQGVVAAMSHYCDQPGER